MPKFNKTEEQLETLFDKWLFVLKFLPILQTRPVKLQERIFKELFDIAETENFTPEEAADYEERLKIYRDMKNVIDTAVAEARAEGRAEGELAGEVRGEARGKKEAQLAIARKLKSQGVEESVIIAATGLSADEIKAL